MSADREPLVNGKPLSQFLAEQEAGGGEITDADRAEAMRKYHQKRRNSASGRPIQGGGTGTLFPRGLRYTQRVAGVRIT